MSQAATLEIPGYRIHRVLGEGGMATVYLATQDKLKREVALKVILPQHAQDAEFRDRFLSEGQLTARLFHRHVMTVFDIGESNGCFYMATEVLSGGTLDEKLPSIHSVVDKLLILREVAEGLGYAHQHQIIHRDIKPGNVLFRADGTAVVADFGIAKSLDMTRAQTISGMIVGTPSYMSPEQVQGQPLDGRSDLYSLGIMFYQMLTGELPFVAGDVFAVAMAQIARLADPLPPHLKPLQPLLDSMIEKLPNRRVGSAAELCAHIDALLPTLDDAALSQGGSTARSARTRGTQRSSALSGGAVSSTIYVSSKRNRWLAAVLIGGLALAGLGLWGLRSPSSERSEGVGAAPTETVTVPATSLPTANMSADEAWLALASQVRERIDQRRYFAPAGGSAHDALRLMLSERPTDIDALELARALCVAVAADANRLIEAGDLSQAGLLISQAKASFPNDAGLASVEARLRGDAAAGNTDTSSASVKPLSQLRQLAEKAIRDARISSPSGDNAVGYFRDILRQAPDDADASQQLRRIASDYAAAAQGLLDSGDPGQANAAALRGLEALPGDPQLLRLQGLARSAERP